jgi:NAD(P)H-dependent FMN reductase
MPPPRILAFAGSLRRDSFNKKLVRVAARGAEAAGAEVTVLDLADYRMPVFDEDLEKAEGMPESVARFRAQLLAHQGLLIASPEYNSSVTAALKNAIDWASRPVEGEPPMACFAGKIAGIMAASPGGLGGLRGLVTLRSILSNIQVIVLPVQHAISQAHDAFGADGDLVDERKRGNIEAIGARVAEVTEKLHG